MEDKRKWKMVGLVALVVSIGAVAVAQHGAFETVTVTNWFNVGGALIEGKTQITPTPGEPPIIEPYADYAGTQSYYPDLGTNENYSLLFTRSVIVVETFTNGVKGQVTADDNGDVELKQLTREETIRTYSIYAEKIIDNNTLQDVVYPPEEGPRETIEYRAGAQGTSTNVGTLLRDTAHDLIEVTRDDKTDETSWRINVDNLSTTAPYFHKSLVVTVNDLPSSGGNLKVGGNATVAGDLSVTGNVEVVNGDLTVKGVKVADAMAATSDDISALFDMTLANAAVASVEADEPVADAPIASAGEIVLTGEVAPSRSGFSGDNYVLYWNSSAGQKYQIQSSVDFGEWEPVGITLTGTGAEMSWANAIAESHCLYRVIVAD